DMAIGGTVTSGTAGSILFVGSGPVLAQDNSNFFWDNSSKELGIGTNSPSATLHVAGGSYFGGDVFTDRWLSGGSATSKNTGIGVDVFGAGSLSHSVDSEGYFNTAVGSSSLYSVSSGYFNTAVGYNALLSGTTSSNNVAVGANALDAITSNGGGLVAIGYNALSALTTGNYNTAVGFVALATETSGSGNTAIGYQAIVSSNGGSNNTAIGYRVGYSISTGNDNVLVGSRAGDAITSSSGNIAIGSNALGAMTNNGTGYTVAIGHNALSSLTDGAANTAIGYNALLTATSGGFSTAIGYNALDSMTTGYYNTAIGYNSLNSESGGNYNTAVGSGTLASSDGGYNNTAIGRNALATLSVGADNTAIGSGAGYYNRTGGYNVSIGKDAGKGVSNSSNVSNSVMVGYLAGAGILTGGDDNVLIGSRAGDAVTASAGNIAIGSNALGAMTDNGTDYTVAIGHNALAALTDGDYNTAIGYNALTAATSGGYSTAIGYRALAAETTGGYSTAVGYGTLSSSNGGSNNVALGFNTLALLTTGGNNVAVGNDALGNNQTGGENAALGSYALYNNTGDYSVAMGHTSLYDNTSGTSNVGIGNRAGYYNRTGGYNVFVGRDAGLGASSLSNISNGVMIGYRAGASIRSGGDDNVLIGYQAGDAVTASAGNIAIGSNALGVMADNGSDYTIAIGHNALSALTTGDYNTAIGYNALTAATSGGYSTAIGYEAGSVISTNGGITAVGYNALKNASTAYNAAVGAFALDSLGSGNWNTAVGYEAGQALISNSNNSFFGYRAGYLVTGGNNTLVGSYAGDVITTGTSNVVLGYYSDVGNADNDSNIVIGYNVQTGTGDYLLNIGDLLTGTMDGTKELDVDGNIEFDVPSGTATYALCHSTNGAQADALIYDCSGTPSADYSEQYAVDPGLSYGDVVAVGEGTVTTTEGFDLRRMVRSVGPYQENVIGVISNPDDAGDFNSIGYNIRDEDNPMPIALNGRVMTRVTGENGPIEAGDPLTTSSTPGAAMRATKPGMVIGYALNDWSDVGEGRIMVFISQGWHSGKSISTDGASSLFRDSFAFDGSGRATVSETARDSHLLSFIGSAWDFGTGEAMNRSISVRNAMTDTDSYRLSLTRDDGGEIAYFGSSGDVALRGNLFPSDRGVMQNTSYIYYDGSAGPGGDMMRTNAAGWGTGSYDFAEMFPSDDALKAGELVMFDVLNQTRIRRAERNDVSAFLLAGVVSTRPGFLAGMNDAGSHPMALAGRVPTKVNAENGAINIGDPITVSSVPGVGMRAKEPGYVVGIALEAFDGTEPEGKITVYVRPGWFNGLSVSQVTDISGEGGATQLSSGVMDRNLDMAGYFIVNVGIISGLDGLWSIDGNGNMTIQDVTAEAVKAKEITVEQTDEVSAAGESAVLIGNSTVTVENPLIRPNSRIFVTFYGNTEGGWWISRRVDGAFEVSLQKVAPVDLRFEYLIVSVLDSRTPTIPPADEPPAEEPPAEDPPADEPPADEPPADEPPADEPPADEPPADEPPADEPPAGEEPPVGEYQDSSTVSVPEAE
ncbi:hypothetical protein JW899_05370, partial [Candidatus Uhrbacteria bacterium]|nr:hypothetical protein [Candidatus Uhrbacteria bacterium]